MLMDIILNFKILNCLNINNKIIYKVLKMGNTYVKTRDPAPVVRDVNELMAILKPVYKVNDSVLYVRTVSYMKVINMDDIVGITYTYDCCCVINIEEREGEKLRTNQIQLSCNYNFTYDEAKMVAKEMTKNIIDLFENYKCLNESSN
jgi:hypothetical protein